MMRLFADIKPLTASKYVVDVDLGGIQHIIDRYTKAYGNFNMNPDFQRGHVWNDEQKVKYLEYVLRGGQTSPIVLNCPEFQGAWVDSKSKIDIPVEMVVVDGKQRLTALLEMLNDKIKVFGIFLSEFEDYSSIMNMISVKFSVNNIRIRKELITWYLEMNEGLTAHSSDELERVRSLI